MRKIVIVILGVLLLGGLNVGAQQVDLLATMPGAMILGVQIGRVEGFGARGLGMGGAFSAVADDATAASWNPAGLAQLDQPQIQFGGQWISRDIDRKYTSDMYYRGQSTSQNLVNWQELSSSSSDTFEPEFLTVAYPWLFGEFDQNTFVLAFSYYQNASFFEDNVFRNKEVDSSRDFIMNLPENSGARFVQNFDSSTVFDRRSGETTNYALSGAFSWSDRFFAGLTINYLDDSRRTRTTVQYMGITQRQQIWMEDENQWVDDSAFVPAELDEFDLQEYFDVSSSGWTATLGFLYRPSDDWSFALVYRPEMSIDYDYVRESHYSTDGVSWSPADQFSGKTDYDMAEVMTLGVAYRPVTRLNLALDYSRSDWKDTSYTVGTQRLIDSEDGVYEAPHDESFYFPGLGRVDGQAWSYEDDALVDDRHFGNQQWTDETWRFGAEYTIPGDGYDFLLRAGYFIEDAVSGVPTSGQPEITGYSLGLGYVRSSFFIDLAFTNDSVSINTGDVDTDAVFYAGSRYPDTVGGGYLDLSQAWSDFHYKLSQMRVILSLGFSF